MAIESYIKSKLKHKAVYWSTPTAVSDGSMSYADPVEIDCLWVEKVQSYITDQGRESASFATVYVGQDLDEHGQIYLGELTDLTTAQKADPRKVSGAQEIKRFLKTPSLHISTEYNRRALL